MGIRRLFIAESKGTRKKDSALSSGVLDFCTPNKRLVRKRSRATQSSFPDREKGYENIPFFISGQRHVTRQTNSDKKLPAEQLLFVYFPSRSYLTSREATQSRFLFLFSNGNSFIQRRMKIKSHSRTTFLRFVQGLLLSGKWRKATQSEASKNQSNLSFTGIFIVVNCRCSRRKATRTQRVSSGSSQFQVCPSSSENRHIIRLFGKTGTVAYRQGFSQPPTERSGCPTAHRPSIGTGGASSRNPVMHGAQNLRITKHILLFTDMKLIKAIEERWSPRSYDSRPVNEEQLALLFEAARWAPSCNNAQEWAYYYTTREYPEAHARLAECLTGGNRAWAPDAPVLLVSCGYKNFPGTDVYNRHWMHDVGAANISIALQAASMGMQLHQMAGFDVEACTRLLGLDTEKIEPVTMMTLGYPGPAGRTGGRSRSAPGKRCPGNARK